MADPHRGARGSRALWQELFDVDLRKPDRNRGGINHRHRGGNFPVSVLEIRNLYNCERKTPQALN